VELAVDQFRDLLEDDEFGHSVWDPAIVNHVIPAKAGKTGYSLFEENRTESRVESADTLMLQDLAESTGKAVGKSGFRNETDTGGLKGAESDISDEFSASGRGQVDGGAVVGGSLVAESVDGLLLEELITSELEA